MAGTVRTRAACDRCHSQKLRCPKHPGSAICARCVKAGTSCVYSPPGTASFFTTGNPFAVNNGMLIDDGHLAQNGSLPNAFEWTASGDIDFNDFLSHAIPGETAARNGQPTPSTSVSSAEEPSVLKSACTRKLTNLLLDADRVWARMPQKSTLHLPLDDSYEVYLAASSEKMATKSVMENIFILAQRLIEIYPEAATLCLSTDPESAAACEIPRCTHSLGIPNALRELEEHISMRDGSAVADLALANLLFSCHTRLLDILDRTILLVTSCTRVTLASPDRREPDFDVSEIRIGSFVPRKNAAVLMQIALLKHLVSNLSGRLAGFSEAVSSWAAKSNTTGGSLEDRILVLQCESLTKRHGTKSEQISTVEEVGTNFDLNN